MEFLLTYEEVLERVDEYTLYCFYLGYQPRIGWCYHSPYRKDEHRSWSIHSRTRHPYLSFGWKDNARKHKGDIFDLVQRVCNLASPLEAMFRIMTDFELIGGEKTEKIVRYEQPPAVPVRFWVKSQAWRLQDKMFYEQFGISVPTLARYNHTSLTCFWSSLNPTTPRFSRGLCFAYRIEDRYKIYQPGEDKLWKFRTSFTEDDVEGLAQLRGRRDLLVVTKSIKEVMMFDEMMGYDSISAHSENTPLPAWVIREVFPLYKRVVIWFDNDDKQSAAEHYPGYPLLFVPKESGEKDPTDFRKRFGEPATRQMITDTLYGYGITTAQDANGQATRAGTQ